MERLTGITASSGSAYGVLRFWQEKSTQTAAPASLQVAEHEAQGRFKDAIAQAKAELSHLQADTARRIGTEEAAIFAVQGMLAEDEDFIGGVEEALSEGKSLEQAIKQSTEQVCAILEGTGDDYLRRRTGDMRDVSSRILRILSGEKEISLPHGSEPVILAAADIPPSAAASLDPAIVLGICTEQGSIQGHTAILCRTLRIPAIVSLGAIPRSWEGQHVLLRAEEGELILDPDEAQMALFRTEQEEQERARMLCEEVRGKVSETRDGHRIHVFANASSPREIQAALENDADGVGLLRSEVLFLSASRPPDEETQTAYYRKCAELLAGRKLIIRTLDIGADKNTPYWKSAPEENPALGLRAIRFCLCHPDLFLTQLRAILRASAHGDVSLMLPMIVTREEIRAAKRLLEEAKNALRAEGKAFREQIELGIMIETPAAALIASDLAREVDFFSIGTNDLTQYTLAADRQNPELSRMLPYDHEAVFRLIRKSIEAAHGAGIWCGICGEMGSDPALTERFAAMGIDELSVIPSAVLPIRAAIRRSHARTEIAERKD